MKAHGENLDSVAGFGIRTRWVTSLWAMERVEREADPWTCVYGMCWTNEGGGPLRRSVVTNGGRK